METPSLFVCGHLVGQTHAMFERYVVIIACF